MTYQQLLQNREAYRLAEASVEFALQWSAMDWEPVDSRDRNRLCIEWAAEFQSELPAGPGELSFRMGGIHGAIICRRDDWSSHT